MRKGIGGSSPAATPRLAQSIVRPSRRAGVPVLRRPSRNSSASRRCESPLAGGSPWRPAGVFSSPRWIRPRRKVPVVSTTAPARRDAAVGRDNAGHRAAFHHQVLHRPLDHLEIGRRPDRGLHGRAVELAVGLGARALHGRPLGTVEQPELDAGRVGDAPHQAVQRIDLAHQVALTEPADSRVARHLANCREFVGDQRGACAHAGRRSRSLAAGMAATDNDDVEGRLEHWVAISFSGRGGPYQTDRPRQNAYGRCALVRQTVPAGAEAPDCFT